MGSQLGGAGRRRASTSCELLSCKDPRPASIDISPFRKPPLSLLPFPSSGELSPLEKKGDHFLASDCLTIP